MDFELEYDRINADQIMRFEEKHKIQLPDEYKAFILKHNGGILKSNRKFVVSQGKAKVVSYLMKFLPLSERDFPNLDELYNIYANKSPIPLIPIALDPRDNLICIDLSHKGFGKVVFWDIMMEEHIDRRDYKPTMKYISVISDSFDKLITNLLPE